MFQYLQTAARLIQIQKQAEDRGVDFEVRREGLVIDCVAVLW